MIFNGCEDYWKQVVKDFIENGYFEEYDFTDSEIESVVDSLLEDQTMWTEIDCTIDYYLNNLRSTKESYMNKGEQYDKISLW